MSLIPTAVPPSPCNRCPRCASDNPLEADVLMVALECWIDWAVTGSRSIPVPRCAIPGTAFGAAALAAGDLTRPDEPVDVAAVDVADWDFTTHVLPLELDRWRSPPDATPEGNVEGAPSMR